MKRDIDLMKQLLLIIENKHDGIHLLENEEIELQKLSYEQICYHSELLYEEGLISHFEKSNYLEGNGGCFMCGGLTSRGHDFIELIRNPEIWDKTKEEITTKKFPQTIEWIAKIAGVFTGNMFKELNS